MSTATSYINNATEKETRDQAHNKFSVAPLYQQPTDLTLEVMGSTLVNVSDLLCCVLVALDNLAQDILS